MKPSTKKPQSTRPKKVYENVKADFGALSKKYKIIREIGRGAYGVVYLGQSIVEKGEDE